MDALDGIRILDLTGDVAGPLGVLQLAEHGADVIKVEPPGGSPGRSSHASPVYDRSRRSATVDLLSSEGLELFGRMCANADVVVESFEPRERAAIGLDPDQICATNERLVWCSVPAWPSGTRMEGLPGHEALVQARTGQQWEVTGFRPGPMFLHSPVAGLAASFLVPAGIMAALVSRNRTGRGQHIEVSLFQGTMALTTQVWNWTDQGQFLLGKSHPPGIHQDSVFECANNEWIHAATMSGVAQKASEESLLGMKEVPVLELMGMSPEQRREHRERKRDAYRRQDRDRLVERFHEAGLGAEAIVAPEEKYRHPQLLATGSVVEVDDPEFGRTTQLGQTVFLERTPGRVKGPRPQPGAHTNEVLAEMGIP